MLCTRGDQNSYLCSGKSKHGVQKTRMDLILYGLSS